LNIDTAKRIELSRQNARECRARKKLRYQYVEELVVGREKAVEALRQELATVTSGILLYFSVFVSTVIECIIIIIIIFVY